ncbi:MAG TPA: alpha/beta fold hydrolase [Patescibacteria group bacterium]|nr:alpha/beta fold hydrolase [Patescibacteria group bacterium]
MPRASILLAATAATVSLALAGYGIASVVVYERLTSVGPCPAGWASNGPTHFSMNGPDGRPLAGHGGFDTSPYLMPEPENVRIPSRVVGIELAGWFIAGADPGAPVVVVVHGRGACRRDPTALLPAGMLHRNGFAVLMVDLREHGESTIEDGHFAAGTEESLDILGAWDWLRTNRSVAPDRIGLAGVSLGAATSLIAAGREPAVAGVWADSSHADLPEFIRDELARQGYPTFLDIGAVVAGRLLRGDDLAAVSPLDSVRRFAGRPLSITHGEADVVIDVRHGRALVAAARASGTTPATWFVPGSGHTLAMVDQPTEYERRIVAFFRAALGR